MTTIAIPRPLATGALWDPGNEGEPDTWFNPGKQLVARRRTVRQLLERWIAQVKSLPYDKVEGSIRGSALNNDVVMQMQALMLDAPADSPNSMSMVTGPVADFYRLAAKGYVQKQYVNTDEQFLFDKKLLADIETAANSEVLEVSYVSTVLVSFVTLLESFIYVSDRTEWNELTDALVKISSSLTIIVPLLKDHAPWIRFAGPLMNRESIDIKDIQAKHQARAQEYNLTLWAAGWESLSMEQFGTYDLGGGGECFFLSVGFADANTDQERAMFTPVKNTILLSHRVRETIIRAMQLEADYEYYCETVLTSLTGEAFDEFVDNDCNEELFGEKTLMFQAATINGKYDTPRPQYAKYDDESLDETSHRRKLVYNAYLTVMSRSKYTHLMKYQSNAVFKASVDQLYLRLSQTYPTNDRLQMVNSEAFLLNLIQTPFAAAPIVEAAANALRMRINIYGKTPPRYHQVASYGRLSFSTWCAIFHNPDSRHFMPIVTPTDSPTPKPAGSSSRMMPPEDIVSDAVQRIAVPADDEAASGLEAWVTHLEKLAEDMISNYKERNKRNERKRYLFYQAMVRGGELVWDKNQKKMRDRSPTDQMN